MSNIWFTSDTHYHHKNIVRGTSGWKDVLSNGQESSQRTRDFNTLEEHDEVLVNNINKVVKENDTLWHLGDWSFGGMVQIWELRRRLNCKNIHLVFGNHDHHIENNSKIRLDPGIIASYGGFVLEENQVEIQARDLFSSVQYYKELSVGGQRFILSHFAFRVWNKSHHGALHLYGHSHNTLPGVGRSMDVGVDTHKEFRPYHLNEIIEILSKKEVQIVDHHNNETN